MYAKLVTPQYRLFLPEADLETGFDVNYVSSRSSHCDICKLSLDPEVAIILQGQDVSECAVQMGNDEDYDDLIQGTGEWQEEGRTILIRDGMARLLNTEVRATFLSCHPQEAVRYILCLAGVDRYVLSEEPYETKRVFSVDAQNACDALKQLNAAWGISTAFFYWNDTFYWGTQPEQEQLLELNDDNVLDLEKNGDLWTADIVGLPWIHHSQLVMVNCEELIGVGLVEKCVIQSRGEAFTDMYLTFSIVEDENG